MTTNTPPNDRLLYGVTEAGAVLGLGRTTVYALITAGELRAVHVGRRALIHRDELERFAASLADEAA